MAVPPSALRGASPGVLGDRLGTRPGGAATLQHNLRVG